MAAIELINLMDNSPNEDTHPDDQNLFGSSKNLLFSLSKILPGALLISPVLDPFCHIFCNDEIEKITGYPKSFFINSSDNYKQKVNPHDWHRLYAAITDSQFKELDYHVIYRFYHSSKKWLWLEEFGVHYTDSEKRSFIIKYVRDKS